MSALYRKKPLPVEARQVPPSEDGQAGLDLAAWCKGSVSGTYADPKIFVPTLEGELVARVGDWIVKGPRGEFWPVKGSIFADTYEAIPAAGEFFEPGHTYRIDDNGDRLHPWIFEVRYIDLEPDTGRRLAFGYLHSGTGLGIGHIEYEASWSRGWTDIIPAGAR